MARFPLRSSRGRQKVNLSLIENMSSRLVTFTKRRLGLFKKISELCILCGVQAASIVFSPADKVYSFGHPMVDVVVDRFLITNGAPLYVHAPHNPQEDAGLTMLYLELTRLKEERELENEKTDELQNFRKTLAPEMLKVLSPPEELTLPELINVRDMLSELRNRLHQHYMGVTEGIAPTGPVQPSNPSFMEQGQSSFSEQNAFEGLMTFGDPTQMSTEPQQQVSDPSMAMLQTTLAGFFQDPQQQVPDPSFAMTQTNPTGFFPGPPIETGGQFYQPQMPYAPQQLVSDPSMGITQTTPTGLFQGPPIAIRPNVIGGPSYNPNIPFAFSIPNTMDESFTNPNMIQPFSVPPNNPAGGQLGGQQGMPAPSGIQVNPAGGQLGGQQGMPAPSGEQVNPALSPAGYFTNLLLHGDDAPTSPTPSDNQN